MLHLEHRNTLASLEEAKMLNDYLSEKGLDTNKDYNTFVRVQAQESAGTGKVLDGANMQLMALIGEQKGGKLSTIVVIENEEKRKEFLSTLKTFTGENMAFAIYSLNVPELLEANGKSGAAIEKVENGKITRYAKLRQVYFGADDGERSDDALVKIKNDFIGLLASGFQPVAE